MIYNISVNQIHGLKYGLNMQEGALMYLLSVAPTWAASIVIRDENGDIDEGGIYFWLSKGKIVAELPMAYKTTNAAYKGLAKLRKLGLIEYTKYGEKDIFRFTDSGKEFSTKIDDADIKKIEENFTNTCIEKKKQRKEKKLGLFSEPLGLGKKSEAARKIILANSENIPTYNNTSDDGTNNNNNIIKGIDDFIISDEQKKQAESYGLDSDILVRQFVAYNKTIATNNNREVKNWSSLFDLFMHNKAQREHSSTSKHSGSSKPTASSGKDVTDDHSDTHIVLSDEKELRIAAIKRGKVFVDGVELPPLPKMLAGSTCSFLEKNRGSESRATTYNKHVQLMVEN